MLNSIFPFTKPPFDAIYSMKGGFYVGEVSVVMQMYQSLSQEEKATFLHLLGLPPELTEIIDSGTIEEFLAKHRFPRGEVCCVHCGNIDIKKNGHTKAGHQRFYCARDATSPPMRQGWSLTVQSALWTPIFAISTV